MKKSVWAFISATVLTLTITNYVYTSKLEDASNEISDLEENEKVNQKAILELEGKIETESEKLKEKEDLIRKIKSESKDKDEQIRELEKVEKVKEEKINELKEIEKVKDEKIEVLDGKLKQLSAKKEVEKEENKFSYELTFYTAFCDTGCTGTTASGYSVSDTIYYEGYRIVAAPPNIPLYTKLKITMSDGKEMKAIVLDRGSAIQGKNILDILVDSKDEANRLGRQQATVEILG